MDLIGLESIVDGTSIGITAAVCAVAMSVIEVSKIKLNPWSAIAKVIVVPFKAVWKTMTADMVMQIESLHADIKAMSVEIENIKRDSAETREKDDEYRIVQKRAEIIRFGDDIRGDRKCSLEHFNNVLEAITEYEHYCDTHPMFENSKAVATIRFIKQDYEERLKTNNFL